MEKRKEVSPAAPPCGTGTPRATPGSHTAGIYRAGSLQQLHSQSSAVAGSASPLLERGSGVERVIPLPNWAFHIFVVCRPLASTAPSVNPWWPLGVIGVKATASCLLMEEL